MITKIAELDMAYIDSRISGQKANFDVAIVLVIGCAGFLGYYFMSCFSYSGRGLGIKKVSNYSVA